MIPATATLPRPRPGTAGALLAVLILAVIVMGHDGSRAMRVLVLAAPLFIWLRWPLRDPLWRSFRFAVAATLLCFFVFDGVTRAYMLSKYQAVPESSLVLAAVANTTPREMAEYADAMGWLLWVGLGGAMLALGAVVILTAISNTHAKPVGHKTRWLLLTLLLICGVGFASKPWRKYHPTLYWPAWTQSVASLRADLSDQQAERTQLLNNARSARPAVTVSEPVTVVMVITDSVNRDNMSLYGYARDTTPQLVSLSKADAARWRTLSHAWSAEAGTLASLSGVFSFGARRPADPVGHTHHLLALAREAGYRIWWMSNHDDIAIDQEHAQLAHDVEMINRQPGRGGATLDIELLDCIEEALRAPEPLKLIVVHLLGAHPDYGRRLPAGPHRFDSGSDAVDDAMARAGRPLWLREMRQTYDAAIHYHDGVVARTARLLQQHAPRGGHAAWLYFSDHGQEVGHTVNRAGHSASTEAGYRIPALVWRSSGGFPDDFSSRPFRADWAGWLMADLMHIRWTGIQHERSALNPDYDWVPPSLPIEGVNFER